MSWMKLERSSRVLRNTPSPGFTYLSSGGFSIAYLKDETVENISQQSRCYLNDNVVGKYDATRCVKDATAFLVYDMGKEALIIAKENAPPSLKIFLPEIHRKRIDLDREGNFEFIYEMPYYRPWEYSERRNYKTATERQELDIEKILIQSIESLYSNTNYTKRMIFGNFEHHGLARIDGGSLSNLGDDNVGISKDDVYVYRDPIVAQFFSVDAVKIFSRIF